MTAKLDAGFDTRQCLIGGRWINTRSGLTLPVEDPSTGQEIGRIARGAAEDIEAAVIAARMSLSAEWGGLPAAERGRSARQDRPCGGGAYRLACQSRGP
jgi:aldehyde dehydrogenase (NAD+)